MKLPENTTYAIWLRAASVSGGKDWVCVLTDKEVISLWGKTGEVNQIKTLHFSPSRAFLDEKVEKKKKGTSKYQLVGEWMPSTGWSHQKAPDTSPQPKPHAPTGKLTKCIREWKEKSNQEWF